MGRAPCCDKANVKRGPWSPEEDATLKSYVEKNGTGGNWIALPQKAGLKRCGKSCRLRWLNYLRPDIKHGGFTEEEDNIICTLYNSMGSRWSVIASHLPGRTDNDVKNYWNTKLKKKFISAHQKPTITSITATTTNLSPTTPTRPSAPLPMQTSITKTESYGYVMNYHHPMAPIKTESFGHIKTDSYGFANPTFADPPAGFQSTAYVVSPPPPPPEDMSAASSSLTMENNSTSSYQPQQPWGESSNLEDDGFFMSMGIAPSSPDLLDWYGYGLQSLIGGVAQSPSFANPWGTAEGSEVIYS